MSKRQRRNHALAFKAKVALAAVRGERTLGSQLDVDQAVAELKAFSDKPDTLVFMLRMFQVRGTRPR